MSTKEEPSKYAKHYDPIKIGSIDGKITDYLGKYRFLYVKLFRPGTDTYPHDRGIVRALNSTYRPNERVVGNPRHTIFVGRLHRKTDEVIQLFSEQAKKKYI